MSALRIPLEQTRDDFHSHHKRKFPERHALIQDEYTSDEWELLCISCTHTENKSYSLDQKTNTFKKVI